MVSVILKIVLGEKFILDQKKKFISNTPIFGQYCGITPIKRSFFMKILILAASFEPRCEKTGFLHMRKQRRRSASR